MGTFPKIGLVLMSFGQMDFQFGIPSLDGGAIAKFTHGRTSLNRVSSGLSTLELGCLELLGEHRNLSC